MNQLLNLPAIVAAGLALCCLAILVGTYLVASPRPTQLSLSRRRPGTPKPPSPLQRAGAAVTRLIDRLLRRRGNASAAEALDLAGVKMPLRDFLVVVGASAIAAATLGYLLSGLLLALVLALVVPVMAKVVLSIRTGRRQRAFAEQLDDTLQLLATSLRAGHSMLQALNSVAQEASEPSSEEFSRVVNETRVGRDLGQALEETAARMDSKDMTWVAEAIAINRQVGGNLAEVLDQVGKTIRERGQIQRQVKALSAEGRLSAVVLMLLPVGVTGFLLVANPAYLAKFTQNLLGYGMLGIAAVLLVVGGLWLRKTTTIKF
jgi:tight adherence protein B